MRIRIRANDEGKSGIFGKDGEIPAGEEFEIAGPVPEGWKNKVDVLDDGERTDAVTNPAKTKKRQGLEKQATELGLGFSEDATDDELLEAIKAAKAG